ncbi:NIPSNAP family protein [Sinorhizobium psoraleae]|uniref:NIPSNAP family protein n=1 Tax=Sinorhizobium psoraleae TaxID=520838 RepID=A0ABT4KMV1_9HYPH|nr:NIPSNAP family protein [Sinorhizobium psoraleae]MCZ4093293.1 NIPSNAP family protein [Sinorhizobium psoraleae]
MIYYELATLDTVVFGAGKAAPGIEKWIAEGRGHLCGAWGTDVGALNRVYLLRSFDEAAEMLAERERALRSDNPFGCVEHLVKLSMDSYRGADFRPHCRSGNLGPIYEFRTYRPKMGALEQLLAAWKEAVPPREEYSPMAVAMYSLDGSLRWTQIWPYGSLAARSEARAKSVAEGKWPPKGGPGLLDPEMTSDIAMPLGFSPLR